ncbi:MAG TPA: glycosyltransferase family 39 protein [Bacteroidales bacterium]|nr:glycosyltransferase family 39 protein [Bacteroidales bacterium]
MADSPRSRIVWLITVLAGSILFFPFLGSVSLFDWDEINFAEVAREMIVTGDYLNVQINFQPFWEKPPLFFWLQVISMKLFGINEFAARFPNALCGICTLIILYHIGKRMYDHRMGVIWMLVYAGSILPFFYFKSGIIDPWFNLLITLGIYFGAGYLLLDANRSLNALLSGAFIGLAVLTKGPVALLLFGLTGLVYLIITRFRMRLRLQHIALFFAGLMITGGCWFIIQLLTGHADVVGDFIRYQVRLFNTRDAGHGGFPLYHVVVLFAGVFPASVFVLSSIRKINQGSSFRKAWSQICLILLLVVLVVFSIVRTKIVHYSSLAYFPLTWMASEYIYHVVTQKAEVNRLTRISLGILGSIWIVVLILLVIALMNKDSLLSSGMIRDAFAAANLQANVTWTGWEALVVLPLILSMILFYVLKENRTRVIVIFAGTLLFSFISMSVILPKAEGYTQRAAIEFYREKGPEDCYIHTLGFKSYAHFFYGQKKPPENPLSYDQEWLLKGRIDKPVYFVYKITRKQRYQDEYPQLKILYERNGFVFARREMPDLSNH